MKNPISRISTEFARSVRDIEISAFAAPKRKEKTLRYRIRELSLSGERSSEPDGRKNFFCFFFIFDRFQKEFPQKIEKYHFSKSIRPDRRKRAEVGGSGRKRPEAAGSGRNLKAIFSSGKRRKEKTLRYRIRE